MGGFFHFVRCLPIGASASCVATSRATSVASSPAGAVIVFHYGMFVGLPALLLEPGARRVYTELIEQACS